MSNMLKLYHDQQELVGRVRQSMTKNKFVLMQACTGFGKSACITEIASSAAKKDKRVIVNVPRIELLKQLSNTFRKYGISHGLISSKYKRDPFKSVYISTTDTLAGQLDTVKSPDLFINDETHVGGKNLDFIINKFKQDGAYGIGASATPSRLDGKGMDMWFDDMQSGPQMRWLIDNKRLNDYRVFAPESSAQQAMVAHMGDVDGDFEFDNTMFGDACGHYKQFGNGTRNLMFCRTIKHAEDTAAYLRKEGINSAAIHGQLSDADMLSRVKAFARRDIKVLTGCQIFTFGWDLSQLTGTDATVESISLLRLTDSLALYMQIVGRMLRMSDSPSIMFDHMGNVAKHGLPCAHRDWTLQGRLKGEGEAKEITVPARQCPVDGGGCGFVHRPCPACPKCGFIYPVRAVGGEQVDEFLVELDKSAMQDIKKSERRIQGQAQDYEDLLELERRTKKAYGWADNVYMGRKGTLATREQLKIRRALWKAKN